MTADEAARRFNAHLLDFPFLNECVIVRSRTGRITTALRVTVDMRKLPTTKSNFEDVEELKTAFREFIVEPETGIRTEVWSRPAWGEKLNRREDGHTKLKTLRRAADPNLQGERATASVKRTLKAVKATSKLDAGPYAKAVVAALAQVIPRRFIKSAIRAL
jgi:hypothetical protein